MKYVTVMMLESMNKYELVPEVVFENMSPGDAAREWVSNGDHPNGVFGELSIVHHYGGYRVSVRDQKSKTWADFFLVRVDG